MMSQRAAGGGSAVQNDLLNGLLRAVRNHKKVGTVGNRTRYQSGVYDSTCESGCETLS